MTLRITLSLVPYGIEENIHQIGQIDIWNLGRNADQTSNYGVVQLKKAPSPEDAVALADSKGLVTFNRHGIITDVTDCDDEDVKIVSVIGHDRRTRDATDLLYRALVALGYADRNPDPKSPRQYGADKKFKGFATIDFEASALSVHADVLEVGIAIFDGEYTVRTWSSLVRPNPNGLWNDKAAAVHKITREELMDAPTPPEVAAKLNQIMTDHAITEAYCDGGSFDQAWRRNLYRYAKMEPSFELESGHGSILTKASELRRFIRWIRENKDRPHRAGPDALILAQAYVHALGKKIAVIEAIE